MLHQPITPAPIDADTALAALAAGHLAALATVPQLTDIPTSLHDARRLAKQVRDYATRPVTGLGMLGKNGIEPAIRACVDGARRHGFDWRERY